MSKIGFDKEYAPARERGVSIWVQARQATVFIDVVWPGHDGWWRSARGLTLMSGAMSAART
ncbi:hypothetical protein [Brevundimonas sp.]|uniref:hypothetical protein n=1 Tax=Brevundimonas sp. TaxID=1871086 RepID=UPI002ABC30A0|nr:hypothetical protein [Brevundimonas sp.]MDZ4364263.1 hypothetical protein [Brevundimonas sp.]